MVIWSSLTPGENQWSRQPHLPSAGPTKQQPLVTRLCSIFQPCGRQWLLWVRTHPRFYLTHLRVPTGRDPAGLQPYNPATLKPTARAPPRTHSPLPRLGWEGGYEWGGDSTPYSQHPQLLEPRKVVLMYASDVVAVEFPGGGKEKRNW